MDLKAIAASAANIAFEQAGNAKVTATINGPALPGAYDPATDTTSSSSVADYSVEGILYRSIQQQKDATGNEAMFILKGVDAPAGIDEANTVTIEGKLWNISMVEPIPTNAVIMLHLRK